MESREVKFKQYREELLKNDKNTPEEVVEVLSEEEKSLVEENHVKKNTLAMSIDQIIEAHDEYTTIIQQKELMDKLKKEKKEKNKVLFLKWLKISGVILLILAMIAIIAIIVANLIG